MRNYHYSDCGKHPDFPKSHVKFDQRLGFYRTDPYPSVSDLADFYSHEYRKIRNEKPDGDYVAFMKHRALAQRKFIRDNTLGKKFANVLDIGCGCGELVNALSNDADSLSGYETDPVMANYAKLNKISESIEIHNSHFSPGESGPGFDLVAMSHVFEHVPNPVIFLKKIRQSMSDDDGFLFIEVPNETDYWVQKQIEWGFRGLGHLNYFTPDALTKILVVAGFESVKLRLCGKTVAQHVAKMRPVGRLGRIGRRISRVFYGGSNPNPLPDYDTPEDGMERVYIQLLARGINSGSE